MTDWTTAYGSAKHAGRPAAKARPPGLDDTTVQALGKLSEAFEVVENARGHLYEFHRMSGMADLTLQDAIRGFRLAGTLSWPMIWMRFWSAETCCRRVDVSDRRGLRRAVLLGVPGRGSSTLTGCMRFDRTMLTDLRFHRRVRRPRLDPSRASNSGPNTRGN